MRKPYPKEKQLGGYLNQMKKKRQGRPKDLTERPYYHKESQRKGKRISVEGRWGKADYSENQARKGGESRAGSHAGLFKM